MCVEEFFWGVWLVEGGSSISLFSRVKIDSETHTFPGLVYT